MNDSMVAPVGDPEAAQKGRKLEISVNVPVEPKGETSYVLLESESSDSPGDWIELGGYIGRDAESVIKQYVAQLTNPTKTYVAVSARHWRPVTPSVEVVTTKTITLKAAG